MVKAVIFDIDGVLIDSLETNLRFFRDVLKFGGYKQLLTKKAYKKMYHLTAVDTFKVITGLTNKKEIDRWEKLIHHYPRTAYKLKIVPDSIEVIKQLATKYKLALVTSRIEAGVNNYLNATDTQKYFDSIVHFGHYRNPKPHPEPLLIACQRLKVKPEQAVYIGDTLTDIQAAKAATMKVILYPKRRLPGADAYAKEFIDIPRIIKAM